MEQGIVFQIKEERDNIIARKDEVYRYLGYSKGAMLHQEDERVEELVLEAIQTMGQTLAPQAVYAEYEIKQAAACEMPQQSNKAECWKLNLGFTTVVSKDLFGCLRNCERVVVFAATIGPAVDLLIQKNSRINPTKGLVYQAAGAMYIEEFCDSINKKVNKELGLRGYTARPRFSPGYGDLPLTCQTDIFRALSCAQKIGLTLMDTMIMAPSKSVTAIIGYRPEKDSIGRDMENKAKEN